LHARQDLEAKLQPLLEREESGLKVVPSLKLAKDESVYRKEQIATPEKRYRGHQ
jgi:hypothetical protein